MAIISGSVFGALVTLSLRGKEPKVDDEGNVLGITVMEWGFDPVTVELTPVVEPTRRLFFQDQNTTPNRFKKRG